MPAGRMLSFRPDELPRKAMQVGGGTTVVGRPVARRRRSLSGGGPAGHVVSNPGRVIPERQPRAPRPAKEPSWVEPRQRPKIVPPRKPRSK